MSTNTFITKKSSKRSQVWAKFLELRGAGRQPILMDTVLGWSYVCVPDEVQPEVDEGLDFLDKLCRSEILPREDFSGESCELPSFIGGWVGFMTYNQGLDWMGVKSRHECKLPKMFWRFCSEVYAFEVVEEDEFEVPKFGVGEVESNISWEEYERGIGEVKKLLRDGETYQVNFAQEFSADFEGDAFGLYARMFQANPVKMGFFVEGEDEHGAWAVCSNSPERLVSLRVGLDGRRVMRAEPIKGTVAHGEDPQVLLGDKKAYAELTMIVDLLRNDLGRVARLGSVRVPVHQAIMEQKNVWHTYSVIEAELAVKKNVADLIRAVFPGGSIVGCPKKRTMEIIDRLVNFSWGAYCGSAGYVSLNGNADFNIMIRTAQVFGERVSFGAGGGIVMDSDAAAEYQETLDKAEVFRQLAC